jgi:hypothetical protein
MTTSNAHVLLPEDLLREIDALVGPRGRSAFLVETARGEVRRQRLLKFLENKSPAGNTAWKNENHPEMVQGAAAWVHKLRTESETRRTPKKRGHSS